MRNKIMKRVVKETSNGEWQETMGKELWARSNKQEAMARSNRQKANGKRQK